MCAAYCVRSVAKESAITHSWSIKCSLCSQWHLLCVGSRTRGIPYEIQEQVIIWNYYNYGRFLSNDQKNIELIFWAFLLKCRCAKEDPCWYNFSEFKSSVMNSAFSWHFILVFLLSLCRLHPNNNNNPFKWVRNVFIASGSWRQWTIFT